MNIQVGDFVKVVDKNKCDSLYPRWFFNNGLENDIGLYPYSRIVDNNTSGIVLKVGDDGIIAFQDSDKNIWLMREDGVVVVNG